MILTRFIIATLLTGILSLTYSQPAHAFSYNLKEYLPPELTVQFKSDPNRPIRRGDDVSFIVTINNSGSAPFQGAKIRLNTFFAPPLGLRAVSPHPHFLNDFDDKGTPQNYDVVWENQTIPALGSKKFVVKYRLHPGSAEPDQKTSEKMYLQVSPTVGDRVFFHGYDLPISTALGNRAPYNSSIADNIFYSATGRFPNQAEHTKWTKILNGLAKHPGTCIGTQSCNKGSFLLKKIQNDTTETVKANASNRLASISDLNSLFRAVHGRAPTFVEWKYWANRLLDKPDRGALTGAMYYHKTLGRTTGSLP